MAPGVSNAQEKSTFVAEQEIIGVHTNGQLHDMAEHVERGDF